VKAPSPRRLAASVLGRLHRASPSDRIRALTGASRDDWRAIAAAFPGLPRDPGPEAVRARERLGRRWSRALSTGRWRMRLDGDPPTAAPAIYVTAHIGSLQALRYALRARGVPAAIVLGPHNQDRTSYVRDDAVFDRRFALDFPHALAADRAHRLRTALERGSLILAADLPPAPGAAFARVLGGGVALDARPLRLARAARVPCRVPHPSARGLDSHALAAPSRGGGGGARRAGEDLRAGRAPGAVRSGCDRVPGSRAGERGALRTRQHISRG
jgi:hypothetical protein